MDMNRDFTRMQKPLSEQIAEEGLSQLKDREVWDAKEMTPEELTQLMSTWTRVADQMKTELNQPDPLMMQQPYPYEYMKQVWEETKEETKVENWDDHYDFDEENQPFTEGDFEVPSMSASQVKLDPARMFAEENRFKDFDRPADLVNNFLQEGDI